MNKNKNSAIKCATFQNNKKSHLSVKEDVEKMTHMSSTEINQKNDNSPQSRQDHSLLGHSTPIERRHYDENKVEESPDFDCYSSPILLSCTQEGANEVEWDWQSSLNKTPDNRSKKECVQCETPKGSKLFQRKRNSNSPLLYKPFKRKTVKMKNIENIGQFAAELRALSEKMKIIKHDKNYLTDGVEENTTITANISNDKEIPRMKDNEENYDNKTNDINKPGGKSDSYDDLFDDSIDDSMARCTQEIEEKFNLISAKGNVHSQTNLKKEGSFHINDIIDRVSPIQSTSTENLKESIDLSFPHEDTKDNNTLKTYSKISLKRDANCDVNGIIRKDESQSYLNNNNMKHPRIEKSFNNKRSSKNSTMKLFDIPDDSFDDCLATCIEDEKLMSVSTEFKDSLVHKNNTTKFETSYKPFIHMSLQRNIKSYNDFVSEVKSDSPKSTIKVEICNDNLLENRKFFKTKSLSDQYIGRDTITNVKNISNVTSTSYNAIRPISHLNSLSKNSIVSHNVTRSSVSTNLNTQSIVINERKLQNSAITHDTGRTYGFDVNRFAVKESGNRFVRHNSTGNIKNQITKIDSQPARCSAEEIEKKRLQAKMRLEAKKKLYSMKITNHIVNR